MIDPNLLSQLDGLEGPHVLSLWGDGSFVLECFKKPMGDWSRGWCSPPCGVPPFTLTPRTEVLGKEFL